MQDSDTPLKIPELWAFGASAPYITFPVPTPTQTGIQNGAASFADGFPPNCFVPLGSGGAGPFGRDFNGLLKQVTAGLQWQQAGGPIYHDAAFSAMIGGYPSGTRLQSDLAQELMWVSTVDNNVTDPDTGGAGWQPLLTSPQSSFDLLVSAAAAGVTTYTVPVDRFWLFGECTAGGGGGAGTNTGSNGAGGGGGAGGTAIGWFQVTPGQVITLTNGAAGTAGTSGAGGGDGGNGGSSSIGSFLSATGGGGGHSVASSAGGDPGIGTGSGTFVGISGGTGSDGADVTAGGYSVYGGLGGGSYWGGGARSLKSSTLIATAFGSGGGGAYSAATAGTPGIAGLINIWG